ncbi:hypothetical protein PR003_g2457 [Phytophthora rubi]|uniref:DUF6818 domain-containing protein n=1 Tax=Phytophthora rubi TaxID=129364 RepID=A0A6A4FSN7_9STRA|nr:hypothetical protein PR003_g2457 [Phytophthora rubi]
MWEEVALEYNSRRGRSWLERDYDSLRRKFRSLYGKTKPTGNNDGFPPKLRPIALAHEVQYAIEMKGGGTRRMTGSSEGKMTPISSVTSRPYWTLLMATPRRRWPLKTTTIRPLETRRATKVARTRRILKVQTSPGSR